MCIKISWSRNASFNFQKTRLCIAESMHFLALCTYVYVRTYTHQPVPLRKHKSYEPILIPRKRRNGRWEDKTTIAKRKKGIFAQIRFPCIPWKLLPTKFASAWLLLLAIFQTNPYIWINMVYARYNIFRHTKCQNIIVICSRDIKIVIVCITRKIYDSPII